MIDFYCAPSPNGWKASILLEELKLPYSLRPVDLTAGQHRLPDYPTINPSGKIPALYPHPGRSDA